MSASKARVATPVMFLYFHPNEGDAGGELLFFFFFFFFSSKNPENRMILELKRERKEKKDVMNLAAQCSPLMVSWPVSD